MLLKIVTVALSIFTFAGEVLACPDDARILIISCNNSFDVDLAVLGPDEPAPLAANDQLIVTSAYSSADRYGVEGLAIANGELVSGRFQGWDGLLVIAPDGIMSIHHVERVQISGTSFNLRDPDQRQSFISTAKFANLSVIQSHLLVTDGMIDVRDREHQPKFWRRVVFTTDSGDVGLFDTGRTALTLFDTAEALHDEFGAVMAFNLDMGAYDYCSRDGERCGLLRQSSTALLTNVLRFTRH